PGRVWFYAGTTLVRNLMAAPGGLTVLGKALVMGTGTLKGPVRNEGRIGPGDGYSALGTLTIDGNYTQARSGALEIDLSSGASDRLVVKGKATLDGKVNLLWPDRSTSPPPLTVYTVLTYGTIEEAATFTATPNP